MSVDARGRFVPRTGEAVISGILTCSVPASAQVFGTLRQQVGRVFIDGFFETFFECDGETPWSAMTTFATGRFAGGSAKVEASAFAFDPNEFEFTFDDAFASVRLRGGGK